jgi:chromosome segregation ATPase
MANADLKKASDNLGDAVADAKAEASKLAEQNRLLTERCAKLKDWQSRSSAHGGSANGAGAPDAMEVEELKNDKEALQNELTSLKKTLEAQQELTAKKNEAASAAAAAGDPEHVATIAALTAEVQALKERDTASNAGKEKAEAATRSLQAQLSKSSGATNQLAKKMRYLMKEVRETRAAAETTKTDMVTFVNTVKPMMKRSLNEARALNDKVAETHRVVTGKYLKVRVYPCAALLL